MILRGSKFGQSEGPEEGVFSQKLEGNHCPLDIIWINSTENETLIA